MNNMQRIFCVIVILMHLLGCANNMNNLPGQRVKNGSNKLVIDTVFTTRIQQPKRLLRSDTVTCEQLIKSIVQGCSLPNDVKKGFDISIDNISGQIITIKISNRNGEGADVPLKWLELNLIKEELKDVTIDPNNPVSLKFEKALLASIKNKCIQ